MDLVRSLLPWYAEAARDLPWRARSAGPWHVLVSEVMLQQTPVARVLPAYSAWLERWPTAAGLAAESAGEAVRQWGRLGYPRRALRLHAAARAIVEHHDGQVPATLTGLRALPGVGDYTARAVAAFAFRQRALPLDTNVRRVLARAWGGRAQPGTATPTASEQREADALLPSSAALAAAVAAALMELGALVCLAHDPRCDRCPLAARCRWRAAGSPRPAGRGPGGPRRGQEYVGTDRQARGALLAVLRAAPGAIAPEALALAWPASTEQRERALSSLLVDGLVVVTGGGGVALPG